MTNFKQFALLLALCFAFLFSSPGVAFECNDEIGCVEIAPGDPVKIGVLQALSGKVQPSGQRYLRSAEIAVDDRNGSILGHPILLQAEDSQCSREGGTVAALKIAADREIVGVIGTTCSGAARGAGKVLSKAGLVMISGSNTSPSLTAIGGVRGADWQLGYFRTAHNDADQGRAAAAFAYQALGAQKAATIDDGDPYSKGLARVFRQAFAELGGEVVLTTGVNKGDDHMLPVLEAIAESGARLVFLPVFQPEGDHIILQKAELKVLKDVIFMGADGLLLGEFVDAVGPQAVGMHFIGPAKLDNPDYNSFVERYESKYRQELTTNFHAQFFDATNLLLTAIESVSIEDQDGTLHIGRKTLRDALYKTENFAGLTGDLTCDEFGDCGSARFRGVRLDDPTAGIDGLKNNIIFTYP